MNTTQRATYYIITIVLVTIALLLASAVEAKAKSEFVTIDDLLCIAVDPWGYGSEFGDMMRPCNQGVALFSPTEVTVTSKPHRTSKPTEVTPPPATQTPPPVVTTPPPPVVTTPPTPAPTKQKCNRGRGNGKEGCDPGNSGGKPGNAGENHE